MELKGFPPTAPCYWCGGDYMLIYEEDRLYKAVCDKCGKTILFKDKSLLAAIETLNTRYEPPKED